MGAGAGPAVHYPCSYSGSQPIGEPEGCLLLHNIGNVALDHSPPVDEPSKLDCGCAFGPDQSTVRPEKALFGGTDAVFSQLVGQSAAGKSHATGGLGLRAASGI